MLSLKAHNVIDYVAALLLLFMPTLLGLEEIRIARNLFLLLGILLLAYSLLTKYEFAAWRILPLGTHMTLDLALGVVLLLAPWALGYRNLITVSQELTHYLLGLGLLGFVAVTRSKTEAEKRALEPPISPHLSARHS